MGDTELQVRVVAAMSSGEGAEETTKDASDIEASFKTGKTPKSGRGWTGHNGELLPVVQLREGHCSHLCCQVWGSTSEEYGRLEPMKSITTFSNERAEK